MPSSNLLWDCGTAYDMFVSLDVLHRPSEFGIRGALAAGVRAHLPATDREILEQSQKAGYIPFHWLYHLPAPKNGTTVLWSLQPPTLEMLKSDGCAIILGFSPGG